MNSYIVIFFTLAVSGLNFLYSMLNTRFLGLSDIGIYSLMVQSINTVVLISDFGLSTAFLKFYSVAYNKDKVDAQRILKNSFYLKSLISLILVIIFLVGLPIVKRHFGVEGKELVLMYTTIFTIGISELLMSKYRSEQRFKKFFIYKFIFSFLRIIPMGIFYCLGKYDLNVSINIFAYSTLMIVCLLFFEEKKIFKSFSFDRSFVKELLHFSKWIFVSNIALAFLTNGTLELYLLKNFANREQLGYFSALLIFFTILNVLNTSLTTLFFPKFAGIENGNKLKVEVKKAFRIGLVLSMPLLILIPFMNLFIKLTVGNSFIGAVNPARLLMVGFFIELSSQVYRLALYINANKKIAMINAVQFLGSIVLGVLGIMVLKMGVWGAVISIISVRIIGAFYMWHSAEISFKKGVENV